MWIGPGAGGCLGGFHPLIESHNFRDETRLSGVSIHSRGWVRQMPSSPGEDLLPCEREKAHSAVRAAQN